MKPTDVAKYLYGYVIFSIIYGLIIVITGESESPDTGILLQDYFSVDFASKNPITIITDFSTPLMPPLSFILWRKSDGIAKSHFKNMLLSEVIFFVGYAMTYKSIQLGNSSSSGVILIMLLVYYCYRYLRGFVRLNNNLPYI